MPEIKTVKEHIAWSYANLAGAHNAAEVGAKNSGRLQYMIRARLFKGLASGSMSVGSIYDDEKIKYKYPKSCCYCGSIERLNMDHLIPRNRGGLDHADNIVWACTSCNSSKRDQDVLSWLKKKNVVPSILLLRRYLKLVLRYCTELNILEFPLEEAYKLDLPFELKNLPYKLEDLGERALWVEPISSAEKLEAIKG